MSSVQTNSAISVDCVIFGFDGENLKALLVRRRDADPLYDDGGHKLPGAMIRENETLPEAAARVLEASTGLKDLYKTRKDYSIHGFSVRMQVRLVKLLPHSMVMNTWLNQQKKAKNNTGLTTK